MPAHLLLRASHALPWAALLFALTVGRSTQAQVPTYNTFDDFATAYLGGAAADGADSVWLAGTHDLAADSVVVLNFWATWCAPCVKELPYFQALAADPPAGVRVVLVSIDDVKTVSSRLPKFIADRGISAEVVALVDPKASAWIDRVSPDWSGAIPATLLRASGGRQLLLERSFDDLESLRVELDAFRQNPPPR